MAQSTYTNLNTGKSTTTTSTYNQTGGTNTTVQSSGSSSLTFNLGGGEIDRQYAAQNAYEKAVRESAQQRAEITARTNATLNQLNLQITQLPQTLAQLEAQYNESLGLMNRLQETQMAMFDPQRQAQEAQQSLQMREFQKQVGKVEASFGARGLQFSATAMGDMMRQNALLNQINASQDNLLALQEKETGIKQEQQRTDLRQQIENSRLSIQQKLEGVNQEVKDQTNLQSVLLKGATANPEDYSYKSAKMGLVYNARGNRAFGLVPTTFTPTAV